MFSGGSNVMCVVRWLQHYSGTMQDMMSHSMGLHSDAVVDMAHPDHQLVALVTARACPVDGFITDYVVFQQLALC